MSQALKSNTTLMRLYFNGTHERHSKDVHRRVTSCLSLHQQIIKLKMRVRHHWVKHWNQTQHSQDSIWKVKTEERRHTKDIHRRTTHFTIIIPSENKIGKAGAAPLCEALKSNTTLTELTMKCKHNEKHEKNVHLQFTLFHTQSREWQLSRELKVDVKDSHCLPMRHRKGEERKRKKVACASVCLLLFLYSFAITSFCQLPSSVLSTSLPFWGSGGLPRYRLWPVAVEGM